MKQSLIFKHIYILNIYLLEMSFLNVFTKEDNIGNVKLFNYHPSFLFF